MTVNRQGRERLSVGVAREGRVSDRESGHGRYPNGQQVQKSRSPRTGVIAPDDGVGLEVMVMAPAANAVEVPGCENIGQPGMVGTPTETGARFTWDEVGNYVYLVQLDRRDVAAQDLVKGEYIEAGSTCEYIAPWNENGVVTDAIGDTVILFCNPKNVSPRLSSVLVLNETASESTAAAVVDSMRLSAAEVYRKTKVSNGTISNGGQVKAVIRTKLKKGSLDKKCI
mgnify:CR=1 FL=1